VALPRALELFAQPKLARGRRSAPTPIREIGLHPADKQTIGLYEGQYGPYVKHGDVSASIPKDRDPATVTLPEAVELLAVRRARSPGKKPIRSRARTSKRS
jgi:DNA topoisomerase-1